MNSEPAPPGKLFLAIDGRPQGPHTAAAVLKLWQEGTIKDDTLICPDGGTAWVTLKEFEPWLRAELPPVPPVPPVGYEAVAVPAPATAAKPPSPPATPLVVAAKSGDGTKGLRIGSLIAALVFVFLPWVEVRCAGQRLAYQSGFQTVIKQGSVEDMKDMFPGGDSAPFSTSDNPFEDATIRSETGYAIFAGAGLGALVLGLAVSFRVSGRRVSGMLAAVALACLGLEAALGFPMERSLKKELRGGMGPVVMDPSNENAMGMEFPGNMEIVTVKYAPWFYAELAALGLAAVLGLRRDS